MVSYSAHSVGSMIAVQHSEAVVDTGFAFGIQGTGRLEHMIPSEGWSQTLSIQAPGQSDFLWPFGAGGEGFKNK